MRTAESVLPGHPDKVCDLIADAILDKCLESDPESRVAIEVAGGHGTIFVTGEVTFRGNISNPELDEFIREVLKEVGYDQKFKIIINIGVQSSEIGKGVDTGGAGDQGIMVGYACNETPDLIPLETYVAHRLAEATYDNGFGPDGKVQVTLAEDGMIDSIVMSAIGLTKEAAERIIVEVIPPNYRPREFRMFINPTGSFTIGGFEADSGLTGRKIVVDAYGPGIPVGGGAFSGKDPTKVDRSGAYMARKVAVDLLKSKQASEIFVKLAYYIGIAKPVMADAVVVWADGSFLRQSIDEEQLDKLTPQAIIDTLDLKRPIYRKTACFGHFGRGFPWDV